MKIINERLINIENREEFVEAMHDLFSKCHVKHRNACLAGNCRECINRFFDSCSHLLPTVEAEPIVYGYWTHVSPHLLSVKCSVCKTCYERDSKRCPECGAVMLDKTEYEQRSKNESVI